MQKANIEKNPKHVTIAFSKNMYHLYVLYAHVFKHGPGLHSTDHPMSRKQSPDAFWAMKSTKCILGQGRSSHAWQLHNCGHIKYPSFYVPHDVLMSSHNVQLGLCELHLECVSHTLAMKWPWKHICSIWSLGLLATWAQPSKLPPKAKNQDWRRSKAKQDSWLQFGHVNRPRHGHKVATKRSFGTSSDRISWPTSIEDSMQYLESTLDLYLLEALIEPKRAKSCGWFQSWCFLKLKHIRSNTPNCLETSPANFPNSRRGIQSRKRAHPKLMTSLGHLGMSTTALKNLNTHVCRDYWTCILCKYDFIHWRLCLESCNVAWACQPHQDHQLAWMQNQAGWWGWRPACVAIGSMRLGLNMWKG